MAGTVRSGLALVRLGGVQHGLAGAVRSGRVRYGQAKFGLAGEARRGSAESGAVW